MEVLSLRDLVFLVMRAPQKLTDSQQRILAQLQTMTDPIQTACRLAQAFSQLVRERRVEDLTEWLQQAQASGVTELQRFAKGLQRDEAAVRAALTYAWSNGPTEGHVNRLKTIRRSMYGRGRFDLLRRRVLLAP